MKAKVALLARINDGTRTYPFVPVEVTRRGIKLPIERNGKAYLQDSILGFYVRYSDNGQRRKEKIGTDPVDVLARYQSIERDHSRIREGMLPLDEASSNQNPGNRSLSACAQEFEDFLISTSKKPRTIQSYMGSVRTFLKSCNKPIDDINQKDILNHLDWMKANLQRRNGGGHPNNTYRIRLRDLKIFLKHFNVELPLANKDWPKEIEKKKEKYSMKTYNEMVKVATEDEKDLLAFLLYSGFRDDEVAYAQYRDINFSQGTINVQNKPELNWTPKDKAARDRPIDLEPSFVIRMKNRMKRYGALPDNFIFPNKVGKPNQHLIRIVQRVAKRAGLPVKIGLHKFRKTFGTHVANTLGLEEARIWLGHEDVQTTQDYLVAEEDDHGASPEQKAKRKREAVTSIFKGFRK